MGKDCIPIGCVFDFDLVMIGLSCWRSAEDLGLNLCLDLGSD